MATVGKEFADRLIAGGGWLVEESDHDAPDNPQCVKIVEYTGLGGKAAYGVIFAGEDLDTYAESSFVRDPVVYWEAESGLEIGEEDEDGIEEELDE